MYEGIALSSKLKKAIKERKIMNTVIDQLRRLEDESVSRGLSTCNPPDTEKRIKIVRALNDKIRELSVEDKRNFVILCLTPLILCYDKNDKALKYGLKALKSGKSGAKAYEVLIDATWDTKFMPVWNVPMAHTKRATYAINFILMQALSPPEQQFSPGYPYDYNDAIIAGVMEITAAIAVISGKDITKVRSELLTLANALY
jgi:hypothetical protein